MIDSEWFYGELSKEGRSLRDMAKRLSLDPSAVSRMLRGERKMSAEEQDGIADYFGLSIDEIAARRRGGQPGLHEREQQILVMDTAVESDTATGNGSAATSHFLERIRDRMAGTLTIAPGVDLTEPADPEWARVYDDDYEYPLHL
jgi:transcriptional regulator with XRE-family HTH domain